jgi:hypothetical protein
MNTWKKLSALVGIGVLALAVAVPTMAGDEVVWATVTGHQAHSATDNNPDSWGDDCVKDERSGDELTFVLEHDYALVVVKSGSGEFANTLFANASAGETVWADVNGNSVFDDDDKGISHIIFCGESDATAPPTFEQSEGGETDAPTPPPTTPPTTPPTAPPSAPPTAPPSFGQSQGGVTDAPSEPDTTAIGSGGPSTPADSAWLLVVALGVLLASVVVLTPARAKR